LSVCLSLVNMLLLFGILILLVALFYYFYLYHKEITLDEWKRLVASTYRPFLNNKIVLITGASSGIGEALAYSFTECGCHTVLTSRHVNKLIDVANKCKTLGKQPEVIECDMCDIHQLQGVIEKVLLKMGRIDILINNAGVSTRSSVMETTMELDQRVMSTNYFGPLQLTKSVLPSMINNKSGHIVSVSSVQGKIGLPHRSSYSSSKHALNGFFDSLRYELHYKNIKVSVICPGYVNTNLSVNALTGDGKQYGVTDKTTSNGMSPVTLSYSVVDAVVNYQHEVIIADAKTKLGILLSAILPSLWYRIILQRSKTELMVSKDEKKD